MLRAALLLGSTLAERKDIRDTVGKFYQFRSKIVHGRRRKAADAAMDTQCTVKGLDICSRALQAIVKLNKKPNPGDWELRGGIESEPEEKQGKDA